MKYDNIVKAKFLERINRFIAMADVSGNVQNVHVKNTGRCKELLVPGATIYLEDFQGRMGKRRLRYSLTAVEKESVGEDDNIARQSLINMDSQAPNKVVEEALAVGMLELPGFGSVLRIQREKTFGDSRLDFYVEGKENRAAYIEVKGVTLENRGVAAFPDAPTVRGVKHLKSLAKASNEGFWAYVVFVIQMNETIEFTPNDETDPEFGDTLRRVVEEDNVRALAYSCNVTPDTLEISDEVPIIL